MTHRRTYVVVLAVLAVAGCDGVNRTPATPDLRPSASTSGPTTPAPTPAIDACLVGTWREVNHEHDLDLTDVGGARAHMRGAGRTLTYRADGTERVDYGTGVTMRGTATNGVTVEETYTGTVEFRVTTTGAHMSFALISDKVRIEYRSAGRLLTTGTFGGSRAVSYTCSADTMTQHDADYRAEYRRS